MSSLSKVIDWGKPQHALIRAPTSSAFAIHTFSATLKCQSPATWSFATHPAQPQRPEVFPEGSPCGNLKAPGGSPQRGAGVSEQTRTYASGQQGEMGHLVSGLPSQLGCSERGIIATDWLTLRTNITTASPYIESHRHEHEGKSDRCSPHSDAMTS